MFRLNKDASPKRFWSIFDPENGVCMGWLKGYEAEIQL